MANKASHHRLKDFVAQTTLLVILWQHPYSQYKPTASKSKASQILNNRFDEKCWAVEETKCRTVYDTGAKSAIGD